MKTQAAFPVTEVADCYTCDWCGKKGLRECRTVRLIEADFHVCGKCALRLHQVLWDKRKAVQESAKSDAERFGEKVDRTIQG